MAESGGRTQRLAQVDWRVYVVLDPRALTGGVGDECAALCEVARRAIAGGAGVVQLRDKAASSAELVRRGRALKAVCAAGEALFIVNDRVDVALACEADGVHLGPDDMLVEDARRVAPQLVIGASAGDVARARALVAAGADYLGVGAIYDAHPSKENASAPRGPEVLNAIAAAVDVPIVGIGGILAGNAAPVACHGAAGVAVIREVVGADDPQEAVRRLRAAVDSGLRARG